MSLNNKEATPTFLNYSFDTSPQTDGALTYIIGSETQDPPVHERFKKFRIIAQSKTNGGRNISVDLNLSDLTDIADFAEKDIELKLRSLKVCQGGTEKNIVVLCSDAFENPS